MLTAYRWTEAWSTDFNTKPIASFVTTKDNLLRLRLSIDSRFTLVVPLRDHQVLRNDM